MTQNKTIALIIYYIVDVNTVVPPYYDHPGGHFSTGPIREVDLFGNIALGMAGVLTMYFSMNLIA